MNASLRILGFLVSLSVLLHGNYAQYFPPTPKIEALSPVGLRMSIPHEDGISLVAYHVRFDKPFQGREAAGVIDRDITVMKNGRWTYEDRSTSLNPGDTVYYWVYVILNGIGYELLKQRHVIKALYDYEGNIESVLYNNTCGTPITKTYTRDLQPITNSVCSGQLIFEDNFDSLDHNRWKIIESFSSAPNYEFVVYMNDEENVHVKDGVLQINPILTKNKYGNDAVEHGNLTLNKCTNKASQFCRGPLRPWDILPPIISGRLNTEPSLNFLYGKIEVRAKLPRGDWIYPLITLEKANTDPTVFYNILIAHSFGNPVLATSNEQDISGHVLQGGAFAITMAPNNRQNNLLMLPSKSSNALWSDDYHTYTLEWANERIILKVDGEQYGEQTVPPNYDTPVHINIGVGVGGHALFPEGCNSNNNNKPWKNLARRAMNTFNEAESDWVKSWNEGDKRLLIDYVKVYAL